MHYQKKKKARVHFTISVRINYKALKQYPVSGELKEMMLIMTASVTGNSFSDCCFRVGVGSDFLKICLGNIERRVRTFSGDVASMCKYLLGLELSACLQFMFQLQEISMHLSKPICSLLRSVDCHECHINTVMFAFRKFFVFQFN